MKNLKHWSLVMMVVFALTLVGCSSKDAAKMGELTAAQALENLDKDSNIVLIDVREPDEFAEGHAPQAQLIPLGTVEEEAKNLDPEKEYYMICRSGKRSKEASQKLIDAGFEKVSNVTDGMQGWPGEVVKE